MTKLKTLTAAMILTAGMLTVSAGASSASIGPATTSSLPALKLIELSASSTENSAQTQAPAQLKFARWHRGRHHRRWFYYGHHRGGWRHGRHHRRWFYRWCYRHDFEPRACWIFRY